jgi:hypothetical protein
MNIELLLTDADHKLSAFSTKLRDDLAIEPPASLKLATTIRSEIRSLPLEKIPTLTDDSPLCLRDRFDVMEKYLIWLKQCNSENKYGHLLAHNYFCFVYLGENLFKVLRKELPPDSVARKCCQALSDNPVRAFRNALAHGNWRITLDQSGIDFWAKKGADPSESMSRWWFSQSDLDFLGLLAIATALATVGSL